MGGKGKKFRGNASSPSSHPPSSLQQPPSKSLSTKYHEKYSRQSSYYPQQVLHAKKFAGKSRLPIQLKQPLKISNHNKKKSRLNPTMSKAEVKLSGPTGLEGLTELLGDSGMTALSEVVLTSRKNYRCRDKNAERDLRRSEEARSCRIIKRQRLLSNSTRYNHRTTITVQRGMRNPKGYMCYRNGLFQALLHIPNFANWLMMHNREFDCVELIQEDCLACTLKKVASTYRSGSHQELRAALEASEDLLQEHEWSVNGGQEDPMEQYSLIFKILSEQLPSATWSILEATNSFSRLRATECPVCQYVSRTCDGSMNSMLPIGLRPRVNDKKLTTYINQELIQIPDGYKCDHCQDRASKKKKAEQLEHSPDMLMIPLLRFSFRHDLKQVKDSEPVDIEPTLDLNHHRSPLNKHNSVYDLLAIVSHRGSVEGGHYICSARGGDGNWYEFNDEEVSDTTFRHATTRKDKFTPYLLFYQRNKD